MNIVFSNKYGASRYLNEITINTPKDYKKAGKLYAQYNNLRKQTNSNYFLTLLYQDFIRKINISKWQDDLTRTHLLNLIHAIHNNTVK